MLIKLVNYFIPARLNSRKDDLRTERIFVSVLMISAVSNLLGINLAIEIGIPVIGYLLFANSAINVLLLFLYKRGFSRIIASNIILGQQAISFTIQAIIQGGLMAPATAAFVFLPALAMLILGKKAAIWWLIVSIVITTGFFAYESTIGSLPIGYILDKQRTFFFYSLLGINATIFFILLVYENSKNMALKNIQKKNSDLIAAQTQLIQSEKMASLGELTAGIAHEIQNPLNFVNNFAEVSCELLDELKDEITNGNNSEAILLANDLILNLQKINHHGKRADAIVKGMLQHSRTSSGQKELSDINALADEYLRLSYHGLRAKDKTFNATLKTDFDETIGKINIIPQDIGRVILNLITNAFYAVGEKKKLQTDGYEPTVTVSTKKINTKVEVSVRDNGNGIPKKVLDKIFQPFFTTKPTGEGTGLGLSLSYDIIKAHGGRLKVETKEGEGTIFSIVLPV